MFPKLPDFRRNYHLTVHLRWVVLEIFLVVILSLIEGFERHDLRYNLAVPDPLRGNFFDHLFSDFPLLIVVVEDDGSVLCAGVGPLPVQGGWVMYREEDSKYISERDNLLVEGDLDNFGMPGSPTADLLVTGIWHCPAGVSAFNSLNTIQIPEDRLRAPEATATKSCNLGVSIWTHVSIVVALRYKHIIQAFGQYPKPAPIW